MLIAKLRSIFLILCLVCVLSMLACFQVANSASNSASPLTMQERMQMYDIFQKGAIYAAYQKIEANRFLGQEKKAIFKRYVDQMYKETRFVPVLVDALWDNYGDMLFELPGSEVQQATAGFIGTMMIKINSAGMTYLSDAKRRLILEEQLEVMGRLEPRYCVLYGSGQLTLESVAQNADASFSFLQTMSNKKLQSWLDTHLNIVNLGALHKGKPRTLTRNQADAALQALTETLTAWLKSFSPEERLLIDAYRRGDFSRLSARDMCNINISLYQKLLEDTGKTGELARLAMVLNAFKLEEVVAE